MKGNPKVLKVLNELLADELTAINQYMVHSEMCDNWGYGKLHEAIEKRAVDEMHHAESLMGRIIFLEGAPTVSRLKPIAIGPSVMEMVTSDYESEKSAVTSYNDAIRIAVEAADNGTRELFNKILKDEEAHVDTLESMRDQIKHMGIQVFLSTKND
jgi:bacterioferritin